MNELLGHPVEHDCLKENYHTDLFLLLKKCARNVRS